MMEGRILNFRRGRHTQRTNQMIVQINGVDTSEKARQLLGKTVTWTSPAKKELKKELKGRVSAVHGRKGAVRVIFDTGMPGQAIGGPVTIE